MTAWIALLRGINVGGQNRVRMQDLKAAFESAGCLNVKSCLQSGNFVLQHRDTDDALLAQKLCAAVAAQCNLMLAILLLPAGELLAAMSANPFPDAASDPQTLHLWFMAETPAGPDYEGIEACKADSESFALLGRVFYLHAPDGIGRSRLAQRTERLLGVSATARNWRTLSRILSLADIELP